MLLPSVPNLSLIRSLIPSALLISALWPISSTRAYEDQFSIGPEVGYANRLADEGPEHGALLGVNTSVGLDDILSMRGRLSYSAFPGKHLLHLCSGNLDLIYLIDIMEIVPYFGVGLNLFANLIRRDLTLDYGIQGIAGIDYHFTRGIFLSLEVRTAILVSALDTAPGLLSVNSAVNYIFEL